MEDLRVLFFFYIVEGFLMTMTGLRLFGYKTNVKILAAISITYGASIWIIRGVYQYYHIPLGSHSLILTVILSFLIKMIGKVNWGTALGAALVSFSLVMLGGGMSVVIIQYFQLDVNNVLSNPWLHVLMGYTEIVFLALMLIINKVFGFTLTRSQEIHK